MGLVSYTILPSSYSVRVSYLGESRVPKGPVLVNSCQSTSLASTWYFMKLSWWIPWFSHGLWHFARFPFFVSPSTGEKLEVVVEVQHLESSSSVGTTESWDSLCLQRSEIFALNKRTLAPNYINIHIHCTYYINIYIYVIYYICISTIVGEVPEMFLETTTRIQHPGLLVGSAENSRHLAGRSIDTKQPRALRWGFSMWTWYDLMISQYGVFLSKKIGKTMGKTTHFGWFWFIL